MALHMEIDNSHSIYHILKHVPRMYAFSLVMLITLMIESNESKRTKSLLIETKSGIS